MVLVPCRSLAFVAIRHANPYGGFLLCVASLLSCLVGHQSDPYRTLIRSISDTVPDQTGHPSDPIGKLSDISPDDCPTSIGTLSALNRNAVRLQIGLVSDLRRNTHLDKPSGLDDTDRSCLSKARALGAQYLPDVLTCFDHPAEVIRQYDEQIFRKPK